VAAAEALPPSGPSPGLPRQSAVLPRACFHRRSTDARPLYRTGSCGRAASVLARRLVWVSYLCRDARAPPRSLPAPADAEFSCVLAAVPRLLRPSSVLARLCCLAGGAPTALISRAGGPGHQDQATSEGVLHCSATARVRHWRELQLHSRLRSAAAGLLLRQAFRTVLLSWAARHLELPASLLASVGLLPGLSLFLSAGPEPVEWGVPHAGGPDWVDLIRAKNLHHHASLLTQQ
jgi:hypothetical protein